MKTHSMEPALWRWGIRGGIAAEALRWFRIRDELYKGVPDWARSWLYWMVTIVMIVFGGVFVRAYENSADVQLNALLALNIGASAPLILRSFVSQVPLDRGSVD